MKIEYFETKSSIELPTISKELIKLVKNKKILVLTTVQFLDQRKKIVDELAEHCEIINIKLANCKYDNQILGCSVFDSEIKQDFDICLYLGDGLFHPKSLLLKEVCKEVYTINPYDLSINKIINKDINDLSKKQKIALTNFLTSKNIGILITTKHGQCNIKKALFLKNSEKYKDKKFYLFLDDTINFAELENFNFIDCWINTACPRIGYDDSIKINKGVINIADIDLKV